MFNPHSANYHEQAQKQLYELHKDPLSTPDISHLIICKNCRHMETCYEEEYSMVEQDYVVYANRYCIYPHDAPPTGTCSEYDAQGVNTYGTCDNFKRQ